MKLEFAFLADAANMMDNGTFDVISGGFDVVWAKTFPATKPTVVLVGRIQFEPNECGTEHECVVEILDKEDRVIFPPIRATFTPIRHTRDASRANWQSFCFNHQGVTFPAPGDYLFRVSVDGKPLGEAIMEAVLGEEGT